MKEILLSQGKVALVDDEDFKYLNQWKWHTSTKNNITYYAKRTVSNRTYHLHRVILGITDPKIFVDHKDHNGLNNQRSNLRICTNTENMRNRSSAKNSASKYLGVSIKRRKNKNSTYIRWRACISANGNKRHIGQFETQEEAALAYNKEAIKYHGEFANVNIINSPKKEGQINLF
jgi:hypothetical protein